MPAPTLNLSLVATGPNTVKASTSDLEEQINAGFSALWDEATGAIRLNTDTLPAGNRLINLSASSLTAPRSTLFVSQDTLSRDDKATAFIQRNVNSHHGYANPKALRVKTNVNIDTTQTEWALSGEIDNRSNLVGTGSTAVSGVANKFARAGVFAGHFQSNDHNIYLDDAGVTPCVRTEMNIQAVGLDHRTANRGYGNRRVLDILARTLKPTGWDGPTGNTGEAEIGVGIIIRSDNLTNGYFRYGIAFYEPEGASPISTGMQIATSGPIGISVVGNNTTAQAIFVGASPNGIILNGEYTGSALRIATGQKLAFSSSDAVGVRFNSSNQRLEFVNGNTVRGYIDMAAGNNVKMN